VVIIWVSSWASGVMDPALKPTQKKVYIGKGVHYFPKANIGEFKIEAYDLNQGDTLLITGPTTGVEEFKIETFFVNDKKGDIATKGDSVTMPLKFRIRPSDKLYKIVANTL